jgi:hypothetical protein
MNDPPNIAELRRIAAGPAAPGGILEEYDAMRARYTHYLNAYKLIAAALGIVPRDPTESALAVAAMRDRIVQLEEQVAALTPAPKERKLREYKGVVFREGCWCLDARRRRYQRVSDLIYHNAPTFSDDDHAPLLALRADPYEPAVDMRAAVAEVTA